MATVIGFDNELKRKCSCRKCTAIIEYALNEVKTRTETDYSGCRDVVNYIKCPNCGNEIQGLKRW